MAATHGSAPLLRRCEDDLAARGVPPSIDGVPPSALGVRPAD
jgi:hypothetical protein